MTIVADFPCRLADRRRDPLRAEAFCPIRLARGAAHVRASGRLGAGASGPAGGLSCTSASFSQSISPNRTSAPKGLPQAVELAKAGGGELRLVNVQPVIPATFMEYVPVDFDEEQEKRAKAELDAILAGVDLPAERKSAATRAGGIYHELLEEAAEWSADLIVVGSHRPVMSDYLLGSNAKTIVRHAQCSVLVVRE